MLRIRAEGRSRGFTLIEILVVMLLLGIVAGLVTLRVERDERRMLQREATRAAAALEQAIALAQFQAVTLGISAQGASYRFWQRDGDARHLPDPALHPRLPDRR